MLEWHFSRHLSVEANALYRELHYNNEDPPGPRDAVVTWEYPILVKYRLSSFPLGRTSLRPFIESGASFRATGNLNQANPSHHGVSAGAGLELPVDKFLIAPTLRYTRWAADTNGVPSRPDQLELLVGFSGSAKSDPPGLRRINLGTVVGVNLLPDYNASTVTTPLNGTLLDGTPLMGYVTQSVRAGPRSFLIGLALEVEVAKGFSAEFDAIFQQIRQRYSVSSDVNGTASKFSGNYSYNSWEFPFLAKYTWPAVPLRRARLVPFLEAGPSFRTLATGTSAGLAAGVGTSSPWGLVKLRLGIRYSRWQSNNIEVKADELDLLMGFTF
jgi:hypothetical protein